MPALLTDRTYVSRFAQDFIGVIVYVAGVEADPDGSTVHVHMINEIDNSTTLDRTATRVQAGVYETQLTSAESQTPGEYTITWSWTVSSAPVTYQSYIEIGDVAPVYDGLPPALKDIVNNVWLRFADLFDSPYGGPNLQTYYQSHWGRNRIAQLLGFAMRRLNGISQPQQTYTTDTFPAEWMSVLEQATYVEAIKHLIRSYTEIPQVQGANSVSRMDISGYADRWRAVLNEEQEDLQRELDVFKIRHMGLGRASVLVSGGIYGNNNVWRYRNAAARGYYPNRLF